MSTKQSKRNMTVILGLFAAMTVTGLSAYAQQVQVPTGSYQQSCSNPQIVNGRLFASCADRSGTMQTTSLNFSICSGDISNDDGHLECPTTAR